MNNKIHSYTLSRTAEPVEIEKLAGWRPHRRPSSPNPPRFYSAIAFLVGFCQPVTIGFVGKIPLSELLLLVVLLHCAIALAIRRTLPAPLPSPRILALVVVAQLLAFGSYVVSDLWWQSLPYDLMRGWVRMLFLLLDTVALALLFGAGSQTFVLLQVGVIFSSFLIFMEGPLFGDFWKFCFAYPVTLLVLLATPPLLGLWASIATTLGLGMLHLFMGYRSLGIGCLLLASLLVGSNTLSRLWRKYLFLICAPLCLATLPWAVESVFSDTQERAGRSNVERSAMIQAAWEGFLTSPLIGNGSWFSKSDVWDNFLMIRSEKEAEAGRGLGFDIRDLEGAAIHSQILTALAEGGILGGTFFFLYTILILCGFWYLLTDATWHWLMPIRLSILISSLCGVFMNPFSGTARLDISVAVALSLVLLAERKFYFGRTLPAAPPYSRNSSPPACFQRPNGPPTS